MSVRVPVSPQILNWVLELVEKEPQEFTAGFPRWSDWAAGKTGPTVRQAHQLARAAGIPFGHLLLSEPPARELPIPDFREGFEGLQRSPSSDLLAVLNQSVRRQDWYRDYADDLGLPPVKVVGAGSGRSPKDVAAEMRRVLDFEVSQRAGTTSEVRKRLLVAFEDIGGLTVATSMVENNTKRMLDPNEFRGFTLVDEYAPLVFVNANQTLNGQLFTLAHEFAHVWLGRSGVSSESMKWEPRGEVERWCNAVASEFLVPTKALENEYPKVATLDLTDRLERLARLFRCGTLVVLHAIYRYDPGAVGDFDRAYEGELSRLKSISQKRSGGEGDFYKSQPLRIGDRLSRAVVNDTRSGRTTYTEALRLMSMKSMTVFDSYADRVGA